MKKRITSLLVVLAMLCILVPTIFAAEGDLVSTVGFSDGVVTLKGAGEQNEAIDVFVLNPGKTVADLNAANTDALFDATVNYADIVYTDNSKLFETSFKVNNAQQDTEYVLYVKSKTNTFETKISEANVYVATNGNDSTGDGSQANPFATIARAKEKVATMQKTGQINVIIGGGEYRISQGLVFDATESGKAGAPVIYKAAEGANVVLNGSTRITEFATPSDEVKAKFPEVARENLVEIDLSSLPQGAVNFYQNHISGKRIVPVGVFLNDDEQMLAQWPNSGYKSFEVKTSGAIMAPSKGEVSPTVMSEIKIADADTTRTAAWAQSKDDMFVDGFFEQPWFKESAKVGSIDASGNITLKEATYYGIKDSKNINHDSRVTVRNVASEVDVPGEYYVDFSENKMYYYAPYTLTSADTFEIATLTDAFAKLTGCEFTSFEGIEFAKSTGCAGDLEGVLVFSAGTKASEGHKAYVKNCKFTNLGGAAISIRRGGISVENNVFSNIGKRAVFIYTGSVKSKNPSDITIANNIISGTGRNGGGSGDSCINFYASAGTTIKNNIIHDTPNSAVVSIGKNNIVKNNEIYNTVNDHIDAGAVYTGRSYVQYGFKVQNNYMHNIGSGYKVGGLHVSGVYLDDNFSGATVEGNVIDMGDANGTMETYAIIQTGGTDNDFTGNLVANTKRGYSATSRDIQKKLDDPEDREEFYESNPFLSFLEATDFVSTGKTTEEKKAAALQIGKEGGPKWNENAIVDERIVEVYNALVAANPTILRRTTITNNAYYNAEVGVYEDIPGIIANADYETSNKEVSSFNPSEYLDLATVGVTADVAARADKEFDLVYPANEAAIMDTTTYITWQASDFADEYTYKVYSDASTVVASGTTKDTFAKLTNLEVGKTYYWTVDATSKSRLVGGTYNCGETYSFKVTNYSFDAKYDAANEKITVAAKNNGDKKQVMMVAAVKVGTELKAVTMLAPNLDFVNGYNNSVDIPLTPAIKNELATAGATLELYIWDTDMKSLTGKTILN